MRHHTPGPSGPYLFSLSTDDHRAVTLVQHGGCHRYLRILGTARQARQVKVNRDLRADWAALDEAAPLPFGPYPKTPDLVGVAA